MSERRHLRLAGALACIFFATCAAPAHAQFRPRIVNGNYSQHHPTAGALLVNLGGHLTATCSGTLIGCNAFVTAAHCVCPGSTACNPSPTPYRVFLQHAGIFNVSSIVVHPSYLFGEHNDLAVVTLSTAVTGISPTSINTTGSPADGTAGTLVGFGVSKGTRDDSGIKRVGHVLIAGCGNQVPQSQHVCWAFNKPFGIEGENSNTCFGDSGGPLFVDFGSGPIIAGITSGGSSDTCLATDLSFDTDVFANRTFIDNNADLSNSTCGTISQVGDANTEVIVGGSAALSRATQKCRKEIGKHLSNYTSSKLAALQRCFDAVDDGSLGGTCPDAAATTRIQNALDRIDPARIASKCSSAVIAASHLDGACAGAEEASDLRSCILAAGDAAVSVMLDREYADSTPTSALQADRVSCQKEIAHVAREYAVGRLRTLTSCRNSQDKGRIESCPDERAQLKLTMLSSEVQPSIERACTNEIVAALDTGNSFGGSCAGVTTTAELAACLIADHDAEIDTILANVKGVQTLDRMAFEVAPGTDRLRVTINGVDDSFSDIDLYVRYNAEPTTGLFDVASLNDGVFDAVEIPSPPAGTWHVLVYDFAGTNPDFQVTATAFGP